MEMYIWLGLMVAFLIAEGACPFHLISIWFAIGSLVAAITAALGGEIWLQATLFALVSGILLVSLWPITKKLLKPKITKTNVDSVIGSQGYVTQEIDNFAAVGQIKLGGMDWTARAANHQKIPAGTLVQVERIEGVKVFVIPVEM